MVRQPVVTAWPDGARDHAAVPNDDGDGGILPLIPDCGPFTGYCLNCRYALAGLEDPRCPECGRPFSPDDRRTFGRHGHGLRRMLCRVVAVVVAATLLTWAIDAGWDRRSAMLTCSRCAARASAVHFKLFGIGPTTRTTTIGPVSRFLQGRDGPCTHAWELSSSTHRSLLGRRGCALGRGQPRFFWSLQIDGTPGASAMLAGLPANAADRAAAALLDPNLGGNAEVLIALMLQME